MLFHVSRSDLAISVTIYSVESLFRGTFSGEASEYQLQFTFVLRDDYALAGSRVWPGPSGWTREFIFWLSYIIQKTHDWRYRCPLVQLQNQNARAGPCRHTTAPPLREPSFRDLSRHLFVLVRSTVLLIDGGTSSSGDITHLLLSLLFIFAIFVPFLD